MKRLLTALLAAVLCFVVTSTASAELAPVTVVKAAKWAVWGPTGPAGTPADTTNFDGAVQDTTAAIYVGDMNLSAGGFVNGPGAASPLNGIKVFLTSEGLNDNVDSVYFRVEHSPDGVHWVVPTAANNLNTMTGRVAGIDQGNTALGTTVNGCLSFFVPIDQDEAGVGVTAATLNASWAFAPYIRIVFRTMASDVFHAARLFVAYPGYRESH